MARRKIERGPSWPSWYHSPDGQESIICNCIEEVPEGWGRKPGVPEKKVTIARTKVLNRQELVDQLRKRNILINPTWGNAHMKRIIDGDISPTR